MIEWLEEGISEIDSGMNFLDGQRKLDVHVKRIRKAK